MPTFINGQWNVPVVPCQSPHQPGFVPKEWAEKAYQEYGRQYGSSQSFQRINERGGFGSDEIIHLLFDRVQALEQAIYYVVSQKGDDICWLDVYERLGKLVGYKFIPYLIDDPEKMIANCRQFINSLRSDEDYVPIYVEKKQL